MQTGKPYSLNEIGRRRNNEDSIFPPKNKADETTRFFVVCDGMGGHDNGEVASASVCDSFATFLKDVSPNDFNESIFNHALNFAFDELDKLDNDSESIRKMGTTLAFLFLNDNSAFMAYIGDSRIYHIRKNENSETSILYKSFDHSLVNELLHAEVITQEEAVNHPKRNQITRYISPNMERRSKATVHVTQDVQAGDRFLLCTDGILESLSDDRLLSIIAETDNDEAMINAIQALCKKNSSDNYSAWLVPIIDIESPQFFTKIKKTQLRHCKTAKQSRRGR